MDSAHRPSSPNVSFTINSNLNLIPSLIQVIFCSTYIRKFEGILFRFPAYLHENYKLHYVQQTMPINNMVNHFLLLTFSCFFFFFLWSVLNVLSTISQPLEGEMERTEGREWGTKRAEQQNNIWHKLYCSIVYSWSSVTIYWYCK